MNCGASNSEQIYAKPVTRDTVNTMVKERRPSIQEILEENKAVDPTTIRKILDRIDEVETKRVDEGFNRRNFSLGVLNCLLVTFVLGRYPEHFWLLFLVEGTLLLPGRMYYSWSAQPLNQVLYFLDYCWIMNYTGSAVLLALALHQVTGWQVTYEFRYQMYATFFGVCCGPLLGASAILPFVSFIFHDIVIMTGLFIHILPPIVMYTLRWHATEVHVAWPSVFKLDYLDSVPFFPTDHFLVVPGRDYGTIAGNVVTLYTMWWIPYVSWMVLFGLDLPRKNRFVKDGPPLVPRFDTVFHSTVRGGLIETVGTAVWGRAAEVSKEQMKNDQYELRDFFLYMVVHAGLAYTAIYILAYPCYRSQMAHTVLLILNVVICVRRGASRYTYYATAMYGKVVRKNYASVLESSYSPVC